MENKDYIEELIQNNLEALNDNEPMDGHFERFEAKLKTQHKKAKNIAKCCFKKLPLQLCLSFWQQIRHLFIFRLILRG